MSGILKDVYVGKPLSQSNDQNAFLEALAKKRQAKTPRKGNRNERD